MHGLGLELGRGWALETGWVGPGGEEMARGLAGLASQAGSSLSL